MEAGAAFPEYDTYEAALRWGFVRKVRPIVSRGGGGRPPLGVGQCSGSSGRGRPTLIVVSCTAPLQVYGILGLQLTLTAVVATVIVAVPAAHNMLLATPGLWIGLLLLCLLSE